ncbi:helix-turn-helix domain-containing protein [Moritella viscosa]|uniref:DNA-binding protein n=1 Tax=Moritella viscosa TaxID=80854 RepID=A0ABY1HML2_9GAMM|nr:helix-turn-helix domain-containing protein [Moritella viscosa]CED59092.1 HTH-type transcriptional regulator [Moritella viscosa]SGZ04081.1 DNA-binding protein [Moritella viscosa]SGZ07346.1 DNA-binding protein [Moritella viscosa]SGZ18476.1 DNA-binding protein [Moritella viscosa]SHN99825.1 DNA-binding protein [Moritella viscosa]
MITNRVIIKDIIINIHASLGSRLKTARTNKGWSLDKTSQYTGVSKAMLGQIERGESSPTVVRLWNIANGFELPLSYFLTDLAQTLPAKTSINKLENSEQDIHILTLFPYDALTKIEVFQITLDPQRSHISEPHNTGVVEHIIAVDGTMEYFLTLAHAGIEQEWHILKQGESVKFNADQQHGYRNMTGKPVTIHNIISYPQA